MLIVRYDHKRRQRRSSRKQFIILTVTRKRRHATPCRTTWESTSLPYRQKRQDQRRSLGHSLYWMFLRKSKARQNKQFAVDWFK